LNWNWIKGVGSWFSKKWDGWQPFNVWSATPVFNDYGNDMAKLKAIFSNPALLKVFCLQCDLFSLGKIYVYQDGQDLADPNDPALKLLKNPNPMQTGKQILWDYMFWNMVGTSNVYLDSELVDKSNNKIYLLENQKMEYPLWMQQNSDKMIFSKGKEEEMRDQKIIYRYNDGSTIPIPLRKIMVFTDLTNGVGNWFKSFSRIDALYKIISNSEVMLDSENINGRFSGKFMVAGTADPNDVTKIPLGNDEKTDIERKMQDHREVHAVKSMVDIKRFVENMGQLKLNEKYLAAYFLIGNMYGIPRDVLEAYNSSTFENQEKARGAHVSYTLEPKAEELMQALSKRFGYLESGKELVMSWDHLPFMQVFEKDRAVTKEINARTFVNLIRNGVPLEEVNEFLDTNFTKADAQQGTTKAN
jgi:hypothetical protein